MSKNNELGTQAEMLAIKYLEEKSFEILATNWRSGHKEVDIICKKNEMVIFVEVKFRTSTAFGLPESFVNPQKIQLLKQAATDFLGNNTKLIPIRFDIIAIAKTLEPNSILHIEDAFY